MTRSLALGGACEDGPGPRSAPVALPLRRPGLPPDLGTFVGRRTELAMVRGLLSGSRAVLLTGPAGVGKSALALQTARSVERAFPGGLWFVDGCEPDPAGLPRLRDAITATGGERPALLLLDGVQADPAAARRLVGELLAAVPTVRIVLTSRVRMSIPGVSAFAVPPMDLPAADGRTARPDALAGVDSVALFVARASAADPRFVLTEDNADAVADLCRHLDGLPLAIELAAARCRALSPAQLVTRLAGGTALFTPTGADTGAPGLDDLISEMAVACRPAELAMWARASVFAGSFTIDDLEAVCCLEGEDTAAAADVATGLIDASVLECKQGGRENAYRLLGPIRVHGAELLRGRGEVDAIRARHREWLLGLADADRPFWAGPEAIASFDHLQRRLDDVRLGLEHCLTEGRPEDAARLAADLRLHWMVGGAMEEGVRWIDRALAADAPVDDDVRARALSTQAYLASLTGDRELLDRVLAAGRAVGGGAGAAIAPALDNAEALGAFGEGEFDRAGALLRASLTTFGARGDELMVLETAFHLALMTAFGGGAADIGAVIESHMARLRADGDWWGTAWVTMTRGVAALGDGRHDEAEELLRACLRLIRHHQDRLLVYWCLELLGALAAARGRHRTALQLIGAAMAHGLRRPPRTAAARRDDVLAAAASALGARVADQLVERGSRLTLTRAVEIALNELPATVADTGERLSEREMQVARFVAQGLSNREIAARLVISIRTAEGHVQRILTKRGFTSRTQVAAWAAQLEVDEGEP